MELFPNWKSEEFLIIRNLIRFLTQIYSIGLLRMIKELFGIKFKITEMEKDDYDEEMEDEENVRYILFINFLK